MRYVLILLLSLLVIDVVWQVFTRYILQSPSTFTDELARFLLIWLSLAGGAYYSGQNQHISINILPDRLSPANRYRLNIFSAIIIMLFVFSVFVVGGSYLVYLTHTYRQITPALQIPMAWVYMIGPLSGLLILYYKLSDLLRMRTATPDYTSPHPENL